MKDFKNKTMSFKDKTILCEVTDVKVYTENYDDAFLSQREIPKKGDRVITVRPYWYSFEEGASDGESHVPYGQTKPIVYLKLRQLSVVE